MSTGYRIRQALSNIVKKKGLNLIFLLKNFYLLTPPILRKLKEVTGSIPDQLQPFM